jgi:NDP-sugar pyrophosphorylase family protein
MVRNGNFNDPIAFHLNQSGKESVHPVKHGDLFNAFFLECPEGTGAVLDVLATQPVPNGVANFGRDFLQPRIFSFLPPPGGHIIAIQVFQQLGNVGRIILKV